MEGGKRNTGSRRGEDVKIKHGGKKSTYLLPAVTSMAVKYLSSQVKLSIRGPYTPSIFFSAIIFSTLSIPFAIA